MLLFKNTTVFATRLSRAWVAVFLSLAFAAGFLCSRALLSVATLLLGLNALRGVSMRRWLPQRGWWLMVIWVAMYALSIVQGGDMHEWGERVQVKLPFLLFPLAWAFPLLLRRVHWNVLAAGLCTVFLSGVAWSVAVFLPQAATVLEGYGRSGTLRTPVYNNHICFSAALAALVLLCVALWPRLAPGVRIFTGIACALFIAYLHLLAAKTGLAMLYMLSLFGVGRLLYRRQWKTVFLLILLSAGGVGIAYRFVPTFATRIGYVQYSFDRYFSGEASANYSDPARIFSYVIAARLIRERPLLGWGAGNVVRATNRAYIRWLPGVPPANRLVPHNQFLTSGVVVGLPATALLFMWWIGLPIRLRKSREGYWAACGWAVVSVLLFVDPAFEVQFGIAVFLLFTYWLKNLSYDSLSPS